jgi:hypothetical protein
MTRNTTKFSSCVTEQSNVFITSGKLKEFFTGTLAPSECVMQRFQSAANTALRAQLVSMILP